MIRVYWTEDPTDPDTWIDGKPSDSVTLAVDESGDVAMMTEITMTMFDARRLVVKLANLLSDYREARPDGPDPWVGDGYDGSRGRRPRRPRASQRQRPNRPGERKMTNKGLLGGKAYKWGTFPAKDEELPSIRMAELGAGARISMLGALRVNGNYGPSVLIHAELEDGTRAIVLTTQTATRQLLEADDKGATVLDRMDWPYEAAITSGTGRAGGNPWYAFRDA